MWKREKKQIQYFVLTMCNIKNWTSLVYMSMAKQMTLNFVAIRLESVVPKKSVKEMDLSYYDPCYFNRLLLIQFLYFKKTKTHVYVSIMKVF